MIWFELRGQFAPQSLHLGTKTDAGVTTACGGRWSHGEDFVAVPRHSLHGKRLCGACFKFETVEGGNDGGKR